MATERIRGRRRVAMRLRHFTEHPLCVACLAKGMTSLATELDHIVPLFKGGADAEGNLQGLCPKCHADKTADDMGYARRPQLDPRGRVIW